MSAVLPPGSRLSLVSDGPHDVLRVPQQRKGITAYFAAAFLIFWLGGWFMSFKSAASSLLAKQGNAFLAFWLAAWTLGGVFAVFTLYRVLRPVVPESFTLRGDSILYDPRLDT